MRNWKMLVMAGCTLLGAACQPDNREAEALGTSRDALRAFAHAEVVRVDRDGVPTFVRGDLGTVSDMLAVRDAARATVAIGPALQNIARVFRLEASNLHAKSTVVDDLGAIHVRYTQTKNGLDVVGAGLIVHVEPSGRIFYVNSTARDGFDLPVTSEVSSKAAALNALGTEASTLMVEGEPRLVYFMDQDAHMSLAWEVLTVGTRGQDPVRDLVYVNALTGRVLDAQAQIHSALSRRMYNANNGFALPGTLVRSEGGPATGDNAVDTNYNHLGSTYLCYDALFGRDSWNDLGGILTSSVHVGFNYVNAYWNGTQVAFGDGDGVTSAPLSLDLDVTSHEITHAVTQSESGLVYSNESGALNESSSDVAGAFCEWYIRGTLDGDIWKVGEDVWTPGTAGDALRYMDNPTRDGSSRDYWPERYTGASDNGGVHWNSGIQNLAFKLLVTGGTHPRGKTAVSVGGIGMNRAAQTFYWAETTCYQANTNHAGAEDCVVQAAGQRYDAWTVAQAQNAWDAVGVP